MFNKRKEIKEKCAIKGPEVGDTDFMNAPQEVLLKEFKNLWRIKKIVDVHDYAHYLESIGYEKAFQHVVKDPLPYERMREYLIEERERL